jgi:hypothetical protein
VEDHNEDNEAEVWAFTPDQVLDGDKPDGIPLEVWEELQQTIREQLSLGSHDISELVHQLKWGGLADTLAEISMPVGDYLFLNNLLMEKHRELSRRHDEGEDVSDEGLATEAVMLRLHQAVSSRHHDLIVEVKIESDAEDVINGVEKFLAEQ